MSPSAVMKGGAGTRDEGRDMSAMSPTAALSESARDRRPAAAGEGPGPAHKSLCQSLLRSPERRALRSPSGLGRGLSRSPGDVGRMAGCRLDMTGEEGAGAGAGGGLLDRVEEEEGEMQVSMHPCTGERGGGGDREEMQVAKAANR